MTIGLDPVLVALGGVAVRWYGLLALVGLALGGLVTLREAERLGVARSSALAAAAWAIPSGVLLGRAVAVLGSWEFYLSHAPDALRLTVGGLSTWGVLVGGGAAAFAALPRGERRPFADAAALGLPLGIALARLGAFVDGSGQGTISEVPWATRYLHPASATPDFAFARHPLQAYDALVAVGLLALLWRFRARLRGGRGFLLLLASYATTRVVFAPVHLDPPFLFGLQIEALLALGALAACGLLLVRFERRPA